MSTVTTLSQQLDAELAGARNRAKQDQQEVIRANEIREERLKKFGALLERLRPIWLPRLELLRDRFAKFAKVQPELKPHTRSVTFSFASTYRVDLKLSAYPDRDVQNLVLEYDLLILPMMIKYERHARLEMPMDGVDEAAIGSWLDERILGFVKTYVALQGDNFFLEKLSPE